jgi:PilZ domain
VEEQPVETTLYSLSGSAPHPVDRRDGERHLTLFRVGTVTFGDRRELCLIKNVSEGGMLIRAYCAMQPGARISVELKRGEQIPGCVNWVRDSSVGITFDERIDVVELLASSMDGPRPRMPRVEVSCFVSVRVGADVYGVQAHDISQGGMKIETDRELDLGSDVVVTLPGMEPHAGLLRWREGKFYGITFNRLLALSEVVNWLQTQREQLRAAG